MAVVATLSLVGCSSKSSDELTITDSEIVVGVVNDAPGFSSGDAHPAGFDINLMNAVGAALNTPVTTTVLTSGERAAYLQNKKATVVIATYSMTTQYNGEGIDFAGPYMISPQALMTRADGPNITRKEDLVGKSVCAVKTTTGSGVTIPGANMDTRLATTRSCVELLNEGGIDAVFADTLILYGYTSAAPHKYDVVLSGLFGELQYYGIGILGGRTADCLRLKDIIKDYLHTQWRKDFQSTLGGAVEAYRGGDLNGGDFESQFKPKDFDLERLSCQL